MRTPLNTQAELIVKLEAETLGLQNQVVICKSLIGKNSEGVKMLEPYAEWGEETTP
jgi:hypothetical protein